MKPLALALCLAAGAARAAGPPAGEVAEAAVAELQAAGEALASAKTARDRVAALTGVIHAYETGLAALREGLRQTAIEEAALTRGLDAESARVSRLLAALESLQATPETLYLLHPDGPLGAVRSGMLLSAVTPELQAEVQRLRARVEAIRALRAVEQRAHDSLGEALAGAQEARTELSLAISNRTDLPRRYADDQTAIARLLESSDTLAAFAEGLAETPPLAPGPAASEVRSALPLPVEGTVIRGFGEKDAAGVARPGMLIAARPLALVTTPVTATIRYFGPLLDYGNVMILEPDPATLLVLAGLSQVYGAVGEVIPAGTPVGLMGGEAAAGDEFAATAAENGGAFRTETLYLELRQGNAPVDPAVWFAGTKDVTR